MDETGTSAAPPRQWTAALVREKLAQTQPGPAGAPDEAGAEPGARSLEGLRRAAAVMGAFDPALLRPTGDTGPPEARPLAFAEDCLSFSELGGGRRWLLKPAIRRETLARLRDAADFREALDANPGLDATDPVRRMIRVALDHPVPPVPLDGLSGSELAALARISGWSPALAERIGPPEEIHRRYAKLILTASFEALAGKDTFAGRRKELAQLRSFVDALRSESVLEAVSRVPLRIQRSLSPGAGGAYVIEAPGGMGKSALIARFILQHTNKSKLSPLLFLYLDWEDPTLVPTETETMLLEISRQLGTQLPDLIEPSLIQRLSASLREHRERFASDVMRRRSNDGATRPALDYVYAQRTGQARQRDVALENFTLQVANLIRRAVEHGGRPVLLVLDTFERVQRFGRAQVEAVRRVVERLCYQAPSLRVVMATRSPLEGFALGVELPAITKLGPLDDQAAATLLRQWGVPGDDARKLAGFVGGSPLSLTLAARVYRQSGLSGMDTIARHKWLIFSIGEAEIQAALYWRYLDQIDNDLRPLAHPGLILRRIDTDVILRVLAEPCGLSLAGEPDARKLFKRLKEEDTLVGQNQDGTDAVRHRADVRQLMLGLMQRDNPDLARRINMLAVAYYVELSDRAGAGSPWARAEEVYHRLQLGEAAEAVDARWVPGLAPYLQDAVEELPIRGKIYLATQLGLPLTPADLREASLEDQERSVVHEAERFIAAGDVETALAVAAAQTERSPTSPLYRLEARALSLTGQSTAALAKADAAAEAASRAGDKQGLAEMLLLSAEFSFRQGRLDYAAALLEKAVILCRHINDNARLVSALVLVVRVYRFRNQPGEEREASRQLAAARAQLQQELDGSAGAQTRLAQNALQAANLEADLSRSVEPEPAPPADPEPAVLGEVETAALSSLIDDQAERRSSPEDLGELFQSFNRGLST